jgi:hypothetical protein
MKEKTWEKHANPWSGWTRTITYPLLFIPFWFLKDFINEPASNWYVPIIFLLMIIWFTINPRIFPKPKNFDSWMSKGVLGEKLWTAEKRYKDRNFLFTIIPAPFVIIAFYTSYINLFWETMFFAGVPFILKLWFLDRMVFYHDKNKDKFK